MPWSGNHPDTLSGLRVLDLTRLLPGPFCTMLLADLGADVIKVESPKGGDYARWYAPQIGSGSGAMGALFAAVNRGKRSLALDLKSERGRELFRVLARQADIVVESFRPGVMERLGLSAASLRQGRSDLIVAAITGYGQSGPLRHRAGHDVNYLALTGVLEQTATAGGPPVIPGFQLADLAGGGLYAAIAILAALIRRERSGEGAELDIAMADGALTFMAPLIARISAGDRLPRRGKDFLTGGLPCYSVYETSDGQHVAVGALEPKFWSAFCEAVDHPEWISGGLVDDGPVRPELEALFRSRTRDEWAQLLSSIDACCEPILSVAEAIESELVMSRRLLFTLGGAGRPESVQTATPITPPTARRALRPAPYLGEHSQEVLVEVGVDAAELAALVDDGIIAVTQPPPASSARP